MAMLEAPLDQITQQLQEFQKAAAGLRRVREMLDFQRDVVDGNRVLPASPGGLHVEFENVRFTYSGTQEVLKGISFMLEPGETLGVLGRTGSGKTTLIRLLFRLYDATAGRVLIDGVDVRDTRVTELRQHVGLVTQDVQLFHGSGRENLTFFDQAVTEDQIQARGRAAGNRWLDGLAAYGRGRGSLGRRVAIARVRARVPQEPGPRDSRLSLPAVSIRPPRKCSHRAVDRLLENRTGIIIAHRLQTVQRVDKILVLADGRSWSSAGAKTWRAIRRRGIRN
jgi:ATP-binding cassette subfamily B protein/ATP-binding cassette subfamily C protein